MIGEGLFKILQPLIFPLLMAGSVNFSTVDAQCFQKANPGGLRRVLLMNTRHIVGNWPKLEDIDEEGDISELPTLKAGSKWAEYKFPDGTAEITSDGAGDPGFQSCKHSVEFMMAGFSKEVRKEVKKLLNAGSVIIVEMKDGQFAVAGSSDDPIFLKSSFKGGKKGGDKRGFTLKGDSDGMMWDLPVLTAAAIAALQVAPLPEEVEAPANGGK